MALKDIKYSKIRSDLVTEASVMRAYYPILTILLTALVITGCGPKTPPGPTPEEKAAKVREAIDKSDALFRQRSELNKLRDAIQLLGNVRDPENRNFEVEWRFSKYNYFLGRLTNNSDEQDRAWELGLKAGRIAANLEPDKPDGHYWAGANKGEQSIKAPITVGIKAVDEVQATMKKVIEIDPSFEGGAAYDALAQIELMTGLLGGKPENAVAYLELAMKQGNTDPRTHLHLAEAYLAVGKNTEARKELDYIVSMKPSPEMEAEYAQVLEKAKRMLIKRF